MAGNASIVVDIKAQITGYEEQIAKIKQSMKQIDPGSTIGKSLAKNLEQADRKLTELTRKAESRISSQMQLNNLYDQLHQMDDLMKNLGQGMQNVGMNDVLATASDKAKELGQQIREAQNQMKTQGSTFFDQLEKGAHSDAFAKVKEQLNFDPKSMGIEQFVSGVEQAIKSAKSNIKDLEQEQESAQNKLDSMRQLQNARNALPANMQMGKPKADAVADYLQIGSLLNKQNEQASRAEVVQSFLTQLQAGLAGDKSHTDEEKGNIGNMISQITQDLMNAKDQKEIENVLQSLQTALTKGTHFAASRGIAKLTGSSMADWSQKFQESYALTEDFKTKVGEIEKLVSNTPIGQQGLIAQRLNELLQPGDAEQFSERLTNLITVIQQSMQQLNNEVNRMDVNKQQSVVDALGNKITAQKQEVQSLLDISGTKEYQDLLTRVNQFEQDITQLKQQLNLETDKNARETAANINKTGENVNKSLPTINEKNISDLKQYGSMLENVQARSQMVGKVEGIAQRWFSVYAAVRMVGKAFRSIKDNVTNLDKTMTEIAIVTDKSQSDLWGQMPEYTAMARKYGASLQGVYEVSQLYYQQGLEQNDVMALTEQTLKMARISGLDYTEATNYMTNAIRSFKIEMQDSQRVVDVYSALAASSASSTTELATAMSKTASSAAAVGSSFENTSAMMAVMIETTRESPENIGSALKSIISRYGELKENKTGIDEEGEEYSLNKVDTALQSVGISIHDAKGEFRDFDDVITELSGKWDTIDKNTQRYIATVMAGNRQQSRFLALVSNGERLAELSETAANSEDASTLQVLKTMDSIDYKSQQLQTTLQSLYTSTGVETFYKGILDGANQLVKTFTDMPTLFNLPIPAMMSVATNFISMANIVMTTLSVLKQKFTAQWNVEDAKQKALRTLNKEEEVALERATEDQKLAIKKEYAAKRQALINEEAASDTAAKSGMKTGSKKALAAQIFGTGMTMAAGMIPDKGTGNRAAKATLGIGGSALQYGALGFQLSGHPAGAVIGGLLGAGMGLWQNFQYIFQSTAEQAKRLKEEAEEAQTTYKQKNATAKNIEKEIANVKKLAAAQYDSTEAREKYIEASNKLAEDLPELVSHYDEEGNAVLDLTNAYTLLANKRKEANDAATESVDASIKAAQKVTQQKQEELDIAIKSAGTKNISYNQLTGTAKEKWNKIIAEAQGEDTYRLNQIQQHGYGVTTLSGLVKGKVPEGLKGLYDMVSHLQTEEGRELLGKDLLSQPQDMVARWRNELKSNTTMDQFTVNILDFMIDQLETNGANIIQASGEAAGAQATERATIKSSVADYVNRYRQEQSDIVNYSTDQEAIQAAKTNLDLFTNLNNTSEIMTNFIMDRFINSKKTWEDFEKDADNGLSKARNDALELLSKVKPEQREAVNDLFKDRDKYTQNQFKERLHKIIGDEDFSTTNAIMDAQASYYKNILSSDDFVEALKIRNSNEENKFKLTAPEQYQDFSGTELQSILSMYDKINAMYKNGGLTEQNGQAFLKTYNELWNKSSEAEQNILTQLTDFSEEGLNEINEAIDNSQEFSSPEQKARFKDAIAVLFGYVPENINTVIENYTSKMATATEDYNKDLSSATKGMDYKAAAEMAKKLGISVTDEYFDSKDGELFLKDTQLLYDHYFGDKGLTGSFKEKVAKSQAALNDHIQDLKDAQDQWDSSTDEKKHELEATTGLTVNEISSFYKAFEESGSDDIVEFAKDYYTRQLEGIEGQFKKYQKSAALKQAKESGKAKDLAEAMNKTANKYVDGIIETKLKEALKTGNFEYFTKGAGANLITEEAKTILPELMTSQQDAQKSVLNSLIDSTESGLQYIEANIYNTDLLQAMENAGLAKLNKRGNEVLGATLDNSVENIDQVYEFIEDYGTPLGLPKVRETLAQLHQKQYELTKSSTFTDIMKEYDNIGEVMFEEFAAAWKDTDISSIFKQQADGSYKANLPKLAQFAREHMSELDELAQQQIEETLTKAIDDGMTSITSASDYVTKGTTKYSDMTAFVKQFNEVLPSAQATIQDLFGYDKDAQGYVLDPQKYRDYLAGQKQMLQAMGASTEYIDGLIQNANQSIYDAIDIKSYLDAESKGTKVEPSKARSTLKKQIMNANIRISDSQLYSESWLDYLSDNLRAKVEDGERIDPHAEQTAKEYAEHFKQVNNSMREEAANQLIDSLDQGGIDAVNAMQAIATLQGKELTSANIESAYRAEVSQIENSFEQLIIGPGGIVTGTAKTILETLQSQGKASITALDANNAVVNSITDIAAAYQEYYNLLAKSGEATLESLNNAKAKVLETKDGRDQEQKAIDALGDAAGMTYSTFGQLMTDMGIELTDDLMQSLTDTGIIESLGGAKMRIKDFAAFARAMKWDFDSEEYTSAFSSFNEGLIDQNKKAKEQIRDEIKQLEEARPGDWLNLTQFEKAFKKISKKNTKDRLSEVARFGKDASRVTELNKQLALGGEKFISLQEQLVKAGAYLEDGILKLTEEANLLKVADVLSSAATEVGGDIGAEMADMVQTITSSYTEAITKGITGNITNADRTNLIQKARNLGLELSNMDFIQTAEGLNLSQEAAISLYTAISETDALQGNLTFKTLSDSLKENNKNYKTATDLLAHIGELERNINGLKDAQNEKDIKRKKQLQEELALAKEIAMQNFTHEEGSWDFLSADALPFDVDNAITYWEDWAQSQSLMKDWKNNGYADLQQFSAMLQHVEQISKATGESIEFMGAAVGGATGVTYDEYLDKLSDVLIYNEKLGKMVIDKNRLRSELGFDLGLGDKGYTDNLEKNINKYLDDIAAQAEALNNIYSGLDSIYNSFHDTSDGNKTSFEDFLDPTGDFDYQGFRQQLSKKKGALEAFDKFTDQVKINGKNWKEAVKNNQKIKKGTAEYDAMSSIIGMAMSEDWDLDSDYAAIAEQMAKTKFTGEFEIGEMKIIAKRGKTVIETKDEDGNAKYYTEDGEYTTAEAAWKSIYQKQLDNLANQFGRTKQDVSNGNFTYELGGETYTIEIDKDHFIIKKKKGGNVTGEDGNPVEAGSTEEAFSAIKKDYIKNQKKTNKELTSQLEKMSDEGFMDWASKTNKEGNYDWTKSRSKTRYGGITSEARAKITKNNWSASDLTDIATRLRDESGLTGGEFASQFGVETGIYLDEATVNDFVNDAASSADAAGQAFQDKMQSYVDESFDLSETASDVRDGIAAAFEQGSEALANITTAIQDGLTGGEDGTIPIKFKGEVDNIPPTEAQNEERIVTYTPAPYTPPDIPNLTRTVTYIASTSGGVGGRSGIIASLGGLGGSTGTVGLAHAKSTLMGELGPEMVVSNNRYFVAGQNGPEFVDLADDAIVFNHLQTQQLLKNGMSSTRGKAVTNEQNAVAYARGNLNGGSAHSKDSTGNVGQKKRNTAGGSSILQKGSDIISKSTKGAEAAEEALDAFIKKLEEWYNQLQEIAKIEEKITYQETLRSKIESDLTKNGSAYYKSWAQSMLDLNDSIENNQALYLQQQDYLSKRISTLNSENSPWSKLYTLDSEGQVKYKEGMKEVFGEKFGATDANKPNYTPQEQYNWLISQGFGEFLKYDSNGKEIEFTDKEGKENQAAYKTAVESFWKTMEDELTEVQDLKDSIDEHQKAVLEAQQKQNELLQEMRDNQMELENKVLDAIVESREREIDEMEKTKDVYSEYSDKLVNGLTDALNKERDMYQMQDDQAETDKMRRRLAILQSSGGSASEIIDLQEQIRQRDRDMYFEEQEKQINAIKEASDLEIERMDEQISLEKEVLEYQKTYGLLWQQVYDQMVKSPQEIADFIKNNTEAFWGASPVKSAEDLDDVLYSAQKWQDYRDGILGDSGDSISNKVKIIADSILTNDGKKEWENFVAALNQTYGKDFTNDEELLNAYLAKYKETSDPNQAAAAAKAILQARGTKTAAQEAAEAAAVAEAVSGGGGGGNSGSNPKKNTTSQQETYIAGGYGPNGYQSFEGKGATAEEAKKNAEVKVHDYVYSKMNEEKKVNAQRNNKSKTNRVRSQGNAFAKGTLLGELGPEAWIANGKFHIAGQYGAEMVNLPDDAIVFNHQQTARLLRTGKAGRGNAINGEDAALGNKERNSYISTFWDQVARNRASMESINYPSYATSSSLEHISNELQNNNTNEAITIEHAEVNMNVEQLANDYDAKRAGEQALQEMLRIARKGSATTLRR